MERLPELTFIAVSLVLIGFLGLQGQDNGMEETRQINVLGGELETCSNDPVTGFTRTGRCEKVASDRGQHQLCAEVTEEFLQYSKKQGNDLITPRPEHNFPGLEPGDHWCLCTGRWLEAREAGKAPPVVLEATHRNVLNHVEMETLEDYAASSEN